MRGVAEEAASGHATIGELTLSLSRRGEKVALTQMRDLALSETRDLALSAGGRSISYAALQEMSLQIAKGLIALHVQPQEPVAILSSTRAEWTMFELGAACSGAVLVPIYHTSSPLECAYVIRHSGSTLILVEDEGQRAKIQAIADTCPSLRQIVVLAPARAEPLPSAALLNPPISLQQLIALGQQVPHSVIFDRIAEVRPQDLASIVYTSGTTGPPKGCMLSHSNFIETVSMYQERLSLHQDCSIYMFLPLAHVLARIAQVVTLSVGGTLTYWSGDPSRIVQEAGQAAPTHFLAVPRVYEKIHNAVLASVEGKDPISRALFAWAIEVGRRARPKRRALRRASWPSRARLRLAERIALTAVRRLFGPNLQLALVGAAPIDARVLRFFDACGVLVLEGYGMTESCAAATLNPPDAPRFGTVGTPLPRTEIAIAADGEVLISGPHVFAGYHRNEAATSDTLIEGALSGAGAGAATAYGGPAAGSTARASDRDCAPPRRWLRTGDLGSLSPEGYLTVTGRKKDLIVTSSGKNIGPVEIENGLRETRWISEAVVYGDRRPYLVAMLTLDRDELPALGRRLGIEKPTVEALANDDRVHKLLWEDVAENNARFARIEQIKRFGVLSHELSQEAGELTPTLKVKRSFVYDKYEQFFNRLYKEQR